MMRHDSTNALEVRVFDTADSVSGAAAIADLAAEWDALRLTLAASGGTAGPFVSPTWFRTCAIGLVAGPRRLRLVSARRGGRLVGVLPLLAETRRLGGAPARLLRSLSDDHSQRFDAPILDDDAADAMVARLVLDDSWDALELRDAVETQIRSDGETVALRTGVDRLVAAAKRAGCLAGRWKAMTSPYLPIPGSVEALDAQLSAKFRGNLRRRRKRLEVELGPIALEKIDAGDPDAISAALLDGFRLEAAGWKGAAGSAIACDAALMARYDSLARAFAVEGKLALLFMTVGGVRRAFHFALVEDGIYYLFKPGYDPTLAAHGPGHLLVDLVAKNLATSGGRELDFLGDDMAWKREWTQAHRVHSWRYVMRPSFRGRALHAWKCGLVPRIKTLLRRS